MPTDPDCIFCKIVAGAMPCFKLFEDAETLAFMDINPVHDGHCLVIPKAHYPTVFDIAPEAIAAAARTAARVAKAVSDVVKPDGLNLIQANGAGAGQSVGAFPFSRLSAAARRRGGDQLGAQTRRHGPYRRDRPSASAPCCKRVSPPPERRRRSCSCTASPPR